MDTCEICGNDENTVGPLSETEYFSKVCDDCIEDD